MFGQKKFSTEWVALIMAMDKCCSLGQKAPIYQLCPWAIIAWRSVPSSPDVLVDFSISSNDGSKNQQNQGLGSNQMIQINVISGVGGYKLFRQTPKSAMEQDSMYGVTQWHGMK